MDIDTFTIATGEVCPELGEAMPHPGGRWVVCEGSSPRHLIVLSLPDTTARDVEALNGPLLFDLCVYRELVVLLMDPTLGAQAHAFGWTALEGAPHLEPDDDWGAVQVCLVVMDHTTAVIKVQRHFTWPPHFARQMKRQFAWRHAEPVSERQMLDSSYLLLREYPDVTSLRSLSLAHCLAENQDGGVSRDEVSGSCGSPEVLDKARTRHGRKVEPMNSHHGWHLDRYGDPTADVICPHGHQVDFINHWDYSLNPAQQTYRITEADLYQWLAESQPWLSEHCAWHR